MNQHSIEKLRKAFLKSRPYKFRELRSIAGCTNRQTEGIIDQLRNEGMKITWNKLTKTFFLSRIPTPYSNSYVMTWLPLSGTLGIVSDTHICSNAERLDLLESAYSDFASRGIKTVLHIGDLMDGDHVYKGHEQFIKVHGGAAQAKYCVEHYPSRAGITTYFISGNHDNRSYEHTGIDQCSLVVRGFDYEGDHVAPRKDMVYLGQYSRFLNFPQNVTVQLLHPRGGDTYSKSYPQQKRAREMSSATRPNLQLSGHLHIFSWIREDVTSLIAVPGFQDETEFFIRQGYRRDIGYLLLDYQIANQRFKQLRVEYVELS